MVIWDEFTAVSPSSPPWGHGFAAFGNIGQRSIRNQRKGSPAFWKSAVSDCGVGFDGIHHLVRGGFLRVIAKNQPLTAKAVTNFHIYITMMPVLKNIIRKGLGM